MHWRDHQLTEPPPEPVDHDRIQAEADLHAEWSYELSRLEAVETQQTQNTNQNEHE